MVFKRLIRLAQQNMLMPGTRGSLVVTRVGECGETGGNRLFLIR